MTVNPAMAADATAKSPWETFSFNGGLFASRSQTEVRFGSGLGVEVNLEDALGMESDTRCFAWKAIGALPTTKNTGPTLPGSLSAEQPLAQITEDYYH